MRQALVAVALAAVIACAGLVGRAKAAQLYNVSVSIQFDFEGIADAPPGSPTAIYSDSGSLNVVGSGKTNDIGSFSIIGNGLDLFGSVSSFDQYLTLSGLVHSNKVPVSGDVSGNADVFLQPFIVLPPVLADGTYYTYDGLGSAKTNFIVDGFAFEGNGLGAAAAIVTISPVPLPAAAPMFGAALLALGGLRYARRSITQPA